MHERSQCWRIAVVGAGPAGLYCALELLKQSQHIIVDLFDRTPTIGGLARYGVAPDHYCRREVIHGCERLLVGSGRFRFFGCVEIGRDVELATLQGAYHGVVLASGMMGEKQLGISGEELPGCYNAGEIAAWYNGHPDYYDRDFNFHGERAVIIGNGNVALDMARMLLLDETVLACTDMANEALNVLSRRKIKDVVIVGRRGPEHVSFTLPELVELGRLNNINIEVEGREELEASLTTEQSITRRLRSEVLLELSSNNNRQNEKSIRFRFSSIASAIIGDAQVEKLELETEGHQGGGRANVAIDTHCVIKAIGFHSSPIWLSPFFDDKGNLPSRAGRIVDTTGNRVHGLYVCGWLKRGPDGVIGSNKRCAEETAHAVLEDLGHTREPREGDLIPLELSKTEVIDYGGWQRINQYESTLGSQKNRPRQKIDNYQMMKRIAFSQEV